MLDIIIETASTFGEVIAVAVTGFSAWVGYKQLQKRPEQKPATEDIPLQNDLNPNEIKYLSSLIVFESDNQRTTLRANKDSLESHLFDARPNKESSIQWRIPANEVRQIFQEKDFDVNPGYKIKTGTFRIGERRNLLYSKLLFPEPNLFKQKLSALLSSFDDL